MIVSVGVVFDMVNQVSSLTPVTPITDFYEFANSKELVTGHIIARPGEQAYFHYQHINLNVDMWKTLGSPDIYGRYDMKSRSENNYHDDYTPHWAELDGWGKVQNFTYQERERKGFC